MSISRPLFRLRRVRSELFEEGYVRRVRQHFALELGVRDDIRSQLEQLKNEVARLTAELARHKAIAAMAGPAPAATGCPRCRDAVSQPRVVGRPASMPPVSEPVRPSARPFARDGIEEAIVLIADKNWP